MQGQNGARGKEIESLIDRRQELILELRTKSHILTQVKERQRENRGDQKREKQANLS